MRKKEPITPTNHAPDYDPETYVSTQSKCNDEKKYPGYREKHLKEILKKTNDFPRWEEIKPAQLMKEPSTQWISWIDNNDKFRIGGVLIKNGFPNW